MWIADWWLWVAAIPVAVLQGFVWGTNCAMLQMKEKGLYDAEPPMKPMAISILLMLVSFGLAWKYSTWLQWIILVLVCELIVFQIVWRRARLMAIHTVWDRER